MDAPEAEVPIDESLIERLVAEQHPDLAGPVRIVENGWDNTIARLGEDRCVRMPRRAVAAPLIEHEIRWLPRLASRLSVPVPVAERVGEPGFGYPWRWAICPWLDGRALTDVPVAERIDTARDLGRFLGPLHAIAPADAPHNPVRGTPVAATAARLEQRLAHPGVPDPTHLRRLWEVGLSVPPHTGRGRWLHGDVHPGNLVVGDVDARLAAVIDFGDLTAGDPASDLAVAWLAFDAEGRAAFREAAAPWHPPRARGWVRARAWAVVLGLAFLTRNDDDSRMHAIGVHAMHQLLAETP